MTYPQSVFPDTPVLSDIATLAHARAGIDWATVAVVCVQHLLASTGSLIDALIGLGVGPQNIVMCGKSYSTNSRVATALRQRGVEVLSHAASGRAVGFQKTCEYEIDDLWALAMKHRLFERCHHVVVLDDGGHCIDRAPSAPEIRKKLVAVEQTTAGIRRIAFGATIPVINVAQSAAKTLLESPLVCEVVLSKARPYLTPRSHLGVVGVGNIGRALLALLVQQGYDVACYEGTTPSDIAGMAVPAGCWRVSLESLLRDSEIVFGCTGTDALGFDWFGELQHDLTLISCSSEDLEFRSLIDRLFRTSKIGGGGHTEDIVVSNGNARLTIVRGGFPVNFDGSAESVPAADIQLTRGLLLGGVLQALTIGPRPGVTMLAPSIQRYVAQSWLHHRPERVSRYAADLLRGFSHLDWIKEHSSGDYHPLVECGEV